MERQELFKDMRPSRSKILHARSTSCALQIHRRRDVFTRSGSVRSIGSRDIIIPSDEQSPGAHEAGVEQVSSILAASLNPQRMRCWTQASRPSKQNRKRLFSQAFMECTRAQQEQIVELDGPERRTAANDLERFFTTLKPAVVDGYRYSEIGVKQFMRWEGNHYEVSAWKGACNHPEHQS